MALAYLLCLAGSLVTLTVILFRRHPAPVAPPSAPVPATLPATAEAEVRLILAAATQLAARLPIAA